MKYGCIGEKLGHSFSAVIHSQIGLYEYVLSPLAKEELHSFMEKRDFLGINVTIPYKKDVIPYLSEISDGARLCGAVNTVVNRDGVLYGFNTDFSGMKSLLQKGGIDVEGKKVLILGTGGTSGTALALCRSLGAERVERVSRTGKDGCLTYGELKHRKDTQVIINTTPCGMFPNMGSSPVSLDLFSLLEGVADAVYNPLNSQLILDAKKRSLPAIGGLYMLVAQAVFAAQIFTGREELISRIDPIYTSLLREKENLVLVGMPGVGKSTLGKELARRLGKEFVDSDPEIEKEAGMTIPEIFALEGEEGFRNRESRVIRSLSERQGLVIATGGGAILRRENVDLLSGNGTVIFLDAPLSALVATSTRPLSSNPQDLKKRYEERYDLYRKAAHIHIPVSRNVEENLKAIQKELE